MKIATIIVVAYLVAGIFYVWRDLNERNFMRMKPYAMRYRRTGEWLALLPNGLGWIIGVIANIVLSRRISDLEVVPIAAFLGVATILWYLWN